MPVAMTFASLIANLQTYLERGSSVVDTQVYNELPTLINLAERAIARRLKIQGFITPVTTNLQAGVSVYAKPDGWRKTVSMNVSTVANGTQRVGVFARSYEYLRNYWPDPTVYTATTVPQFYADYDYGHWLLAPTPGAAFNWEVLYDGLPPLLDATNTTNWTTNYAPEALLYRALVECTPYIKDDARIPVWQAMYEEAVSGLNGEDIKKIVDRSAARTEA